MSTDLSRLIRDRMDATDVPPGDLARARAEGTRIRRRRNATAVAAAGLVVAGVVTLAVQLNGADGTDRGLDPVVPPGTSEGLRLQGSIDDRFSMGGQVFEAEVRPDLDDHGQPTPYGVVIYRHAVPMLVDRSGEVISLVPEATPGSVMDAPFKPGARMDAQRRLLAMGATIDGEPTVIVRDLSTGDDVGRRVVPVDTEILAVDDGVVFLLSGDDGSTTTWDSATGDQAGFGGPETQVLDVRNGVVLYDGQSPTGPAAGDYRAVHDTDSGRLTFDGAHLVDDSRTLQSTDGGPTLELDLPADVGDGFLTQLDTDGSVMVFRPGARSSAGDRLFDCALPAGPCDPLALLPADPDDG